MASMSGSAQGQPPIKLRIPVNLEMLKKKTKGAKVEGHKAGKSTSSPAQPLPSSSPAGGSSRPRYKAIDLPICLVYAVDMDSKSNVPGGFSRQMRDYEANASKVAPSKM